MNQSPDMDNILDRVMTRLDENDKRYGAALDGLQSRLSQVSSRAGEGRNTRDPAAKAALERVESQAAALSQEVRQAASHPQPAHDHDAFRAIEERISEFALRSNDPEREARRAAPAAPAAPTAPAAARPAPPPPPRPAARPQHRAASDMIAPDSRSEDRPSLDRPSLDRPPSGDSYPGASAGDMFSSAAARLEQSLSDKAPSVGLEALNLRMDDLAQRLDAALARSPDAQAIQRIESQLAEIVPHFSVLQDQHQRLEAVEQHLHSLVEWLKTSNAQSDQVAHQAAEEAVRQMPAQAAPAINDQQLEAIQYELRAMNERAERMDERTVRTLETMTESMHLLAQKLDEPARPMSMVRDEPQGWQQATQESAERGYASQDAEVRISHGTPPEQARPYYDEPADLDSLGASIPDFQAAPRRSSPMTEDDFQPVRTPDKMDAPRQPIADDEDDFIASARRAARSAAAKSAPEERGGSLFRRAKRQSTHTVEPDVREYGGQKRARPFFVITAVLLFCLSAYLFYERLKAKPETPPAAVPQQSLPAPEPEPLPAPQKSSEALIPRAPEPAVSQDAGRLARAFETPARLERPQMVATEPQRAAPTPMNQLGFEASVIDRKAFQSPDNSRIAAEMFGVDTSAVDAAPKARDRARETTDERLPGAAVRIEEPSRETVAATERRVTAALAKDSPQAPTGSAASSSTGSPASSMPPATIGPESLRLAAARGNPAAQYEIGARYAKGSGVAVDMERASQWFARAAAQGLAPAQFRLASLHERGQGVELDAGKARAWYERAAQQGHVKAMHNLGVMLSGNDNRNTDYTSAAAWFQKAAQLGLTDSQFNLGILYEAGLGVQKNAAEAYRWFSTAAARGDREAEKRREQVRTQLSAKMLQQLDQFLIQWRPDQTEVAVNEVRTPEGGWSAAAAGSTQEAGDDLVAVAQKLLNALGYDAGIPDGMLGPQTISAIRKFETRSGLQGSGSVTPELVARLKSLAS